MYSAMNEFIKFDSTIDPIHVKTDEEKDEERIEREKERAEAGLTAEEDPIVIKPT
jgi:hypothetical protein